MTSPEQHRTPADPSTASTSVAPPPAIAQASSRGPVTFGKQTFHYMPPELVAQMADVPSISSAPRHGHPSTLAPPAVSLISLLIYKSNIKLADNYKILFCWPILWLWLWLWLCYCCYIFLYLCLCLCSKSCSCPCKFI